MTRSTPPVPSTPPILEFSRPIALGDVSHTERTLTLQATPAECDALRQRFGLIDLKALSGTVTCALSQTARIEGHETIDISGTLRAEVVQSCVITSDRVSAFIHGEFQGVVTPLHAPETGPETDTGPDHGDEGRESSEVLGHIVDDSFDAGEVLAVQVSLELDPFPRKPGASFHGFSTETACGPTRDPAHNPDDKPDTASPGPFAVLAKLRDNHH